MVKIVSPQHFADFVARFRDPNTEPFYTEYLPHLHNLNRIVKATRAPMEGNVFYEGSVSGPASTLSRMYAPKRRNLALLSISNRRILEIGFNTGYSALLMMTANPQLELVSLDICHHRYTRPCAEYLLSAFKGRLQFVTGDSRTELPKLLARDNRFDAYLIDGGHGLQVAETDLINVLNHARDGNVLCFDDTDLAPLRILVDVYMLQGFLTPLIDPRFLPGEGQAFFRINK